MELLGGPVLRALGTTPDDFERDLLSNLYYQRGTTMQSASAQDAYHTLALTIRDRLIDLGHSARTDDKGMLTLRNAPQQYIVIRRSGAMRELDCFSCEQLVRAVIDGQRG